MPEIEFHPIDSGPFALEDHCAEIGSLTRAFLGRVMPARYDVKLLARTSQRFVGQINRNASRRAVESRPAKT